MGLAKEFRDFVMRGNVVDLAVGVVIGAAFNDVVKSLVDNIFTPVISKATSSVNFNELAVNFPNPTDPSKTLVSLTYGKFLNSAIAFLIVAFCLFLVIKLMNAVNRKNVDAPPPPAPPTKDQELLTEIRDLLRAKSG